MKYTVFKFNKTASLQQWNIVNDVVMGGVSSAKIFINNQGFGVYQGHVSIENKGGFSTAKLSMKSLRIDSFSKISIRIKGDGKRYQIRIKDKFINEHAYIKHFTTTTEWQVVEFKLSDLYPTFKGRKLDKPNFKANSIEEIAFLIANKKEEYFELVIDSVFLD